MKETFDHSGDEVSERTAKRHLLEMLIRSGSPPVNDRIRLTEYRTDGLQDTSCSVNVGELLGRGKVAFSRENLRGSQDTARHSFEIRRDETETIEITIRDHANAL